MLHNIWTVACTESIRDEKTGMVSLINVLEEGCFESFPTKIYPFHLVSRWTLIEPAQLDSVTLHVSNKKEFSEDIILSEEPESFSAGTAHLDIWVQNITVPAPDTYFFSLHLKSKTKNYIGTEFPVTLRDLPDTPHKSPRKARKPGGKKKKEI